MKTRDHFRLPDQEQQQLRRAVRLEWATLFFMITIIVAIYLTMGSSQAMKAAWIEDILSLIPPIAFLVAVHVQKKPPDERFPYGFRRAATISFLVAATALFIFGAFILYDSVMKLVTMEHPTVGSMRLFGRDVWAGWPMIATLTYSAIPPVVLGRMKLRLSHGLHEKTLFADANMNKADWMTAVAGVLGILGIGIGWWWADAVAAGLISLDIVHDGVTHLREVTGDLVDRRPQKVDRQEPDPLADRVRDALLGLPWVAAADVRLREEGHVLAGEAYVVPHTEIGLVENLHAAGHLIRRLHWRVYDVVITAVPSLSEAPPSHDRTET